MDSPTQTDTQSEGALNPNNGTPQYEEEKPKVVVIMGPTGSGKSKLAIDLASHFPIEIINADSMQVYQGLDVLTNKVPLKDQKGLFLSFLYIYIYIYIYIFVYVCNWKLRNYNLVSWCVGVPHHLLGTISPNVEFTAKDFRDSAIPVSHIITSLSVFLFLNLRIQMKMV